MAQAEALVAQMKRAELIPDATWRWRGLQKTAGGLAFSGGNLFVVGCKEKPKGEPLLHFGGSNFTKD